MLVCEELNLVLQFDKLFDFKKHPSYLAWWKKACPTLFALVELLLPTMDQNMAGIQRKSTMDWIMRARASLYYSKASLQ